MTNYYLVLFRCVHPTTPLQLPEARAKAEQAGAALTGTSGSTPTAAGGMPDLSALAGMMGGMGGGGGGGGAGGMPDLGSLAGMMQNPAMQAQMQSMMQSPMMQQMAQNMMSNPQVWHCTRVDKSACVCACVYPCTFACACTCCPLGSMATPTSPFSSNCAGSLIYGAVLLMHLHTSVYYIPLCNPALR